MKRAISIISVLGLILLTGQVAQAAEAVKPQPEEHRVERFELKESRVKDAVRLISEWFDINVVATQAAGEKVVTLYLQRFTIRELIDTLCKISGLWYREDKDTRTFRIMTAEEYQKDLIVFREDLTRVFTLLNPNAVNTAAAIRDLYGNRVNLSLGMNYDSMPAAGLSGMGQGSFGQMGAGAFNTSGSNWLSRPVTGNTMNTGGMSGGGGNNKSQESASIFDEKLTPDQLAELDKRRENLPEGGGKLSSETLEGLTRKDPPIYVTVNQQHNLVIVRTSDARAMEDIARLIKDMDRPTPQVFLEMKILELTLTDAFKSVFDFDLQRGDDFSGPATSQPRNPLLTSAPVGPQHILGVGNFPLTGGTLIYQLMNDQIRARIQLLAEDKRVNVLATPMLLASNNRPATVFIGEERVMVTGARSKINTSNVGTNFTVVEPITEVRNIGNTLNITPKINADRTVTLSISQDSSTLLRKNASIPVTGEGGAIQEFPIDTINTANILGTIVAKDKLTLAIGGLIRKSVSDTVSKVPFLGDIPYLGALFRSDIRDRTKTELVLLITPHILMTPAEGVETTDTRMENLSSHPYHKQKDQALESYFSKEGK